MAKPSRVCHGLTRVVCMRACGTLQVCGCMMMFVLFSCATFFTNGGNAAPAILFFITLPLVIAFWAVCYRRYCRNNRTPPLTLLAAEPSGAARLAARQPCCYSRPVGRQHACVQCLY